MAKSRPKRRKPNPDAWCLLCERCGGVGVLERLKILAYDVFVPGADGKMRPLALPEIVEIEVDVACPICKGRGTVEA